MDTKILKSIRKPTPKPSFAHGKKKFTRKEKHKKRFV